MTPPETNNNGRINLQPLGSVLGIIGQVVAIGAALYLMAVRPLETRIDEFKAQVDRDFASAQISRAALESRLEQAQHDAIAMREKFKEVETQFLSVSQTRNVQGETVDRLLQLLWRKVFAEDLPPATYFPVVGNRGGSSNGNGN